MHFKKLKKSVVSATSSKQTKNIVHKNRYSSFNNSDESFSQSTLIATQKVVQKQQQQSTNQLLSEKQMVSINALQQQQQYKSSSSKQKQHVTKKEETKVELKMSKQQSTKTIIHKQAHGSGSERSNRRSRLRKALVRSWKRVRKAFRTVFCCQPWSTSPSSSSSSLCNTNLNLKLL